MKKSLLIVIAVFFMGIFANAQTVLFTDDFESYTTGGFLAQQAVAGGVWTTWSNAPGGPEDATISETFASSGIKSLKIASAQDDIILKLGNKTSGKYSVAFKAYVQTGFGGYFNFQHFESAGIEWAVDVFFGNNGTGEIDYEGTTLNFSHANDAWINCETIIDLDQDSAWFLVDATQIVGWKWSVQSNDGAPGTNQLGGVDFWGGALAGQTPTYYIDDVVYTELASGAIPPTINLSTTTVNTDGSAPESFTITNDGDQDMTFITYPTYPYDANNVTTTATQTELTHIQGGAALTNGIGWGSSFTVRASSKFVPTDINPSIGQEIASVFVGFNEVPANTSLQIYERGSYSTPGAGTLLQTVPFTVTNPGEVVLVPLTTPIYLDGKDLWIGYVCDATGGTFPIGCDAGPQVPGANWFSVGPGWSEMTNTLDYNIYISANLQGDPVQQWLTVTPSSGTILASQVQQIDLSFDVTGLPDGTYHSVVEIGCNDPATEYSGVDVYLTVVTNVENPDLNIGIMTFPNPTTNNVNVKSNQVIDYVNVYDINGKLINKVDVNSLMGTIQVSGYAKGNYIMEIHSGSSIVKRNIVVE